MDLIRANLRAHHRVEAMVLAMEREIVNRDCARAKQALGVLSFELGEHFHDEEANLFRQAEAAVGDPGFSVTAALRKQHLALGELIGEIAVALGRGDLEGASGDLLELEAMLRVHQATEERSLYPLIERAQLPQAAS